jgi:hypothetical protein
MKTTLQKKGDRVRLICAYCNRPISGSVPCNTEEIPAAEVCTGDPVSHGICPDCLLYHFPNEYLAIQEKKKIRIRNVFKKQFCALNYRKK